MKNATPQDQFKGGYIPQQHVMPHSMENREANYATGMRGRDSIALGFGGEARPGLSGIQARTKLSKPSRSSRGK